MMIKGTKAQGSSVGITQELQYIEMSSPSG